MATSGSKSVAVTSYDTLKFSWLQQSQSIPNNATTITWKLELTAKTNGKIVSSTQKTWTVTVNGTKYSGKTSVAIDDGETITLASGTTTIPHGADGTKTFSYSFIQQFEMDFGGSYIGSITGSSTGTLETIAQKSTLSVSDGVLGTAQTLAITRATSAFTHSLYYTCGSKLYYILGQNSPVSTESVSWTPPYELSEQNKTGSTVTITFVLQTYMDSGTVWVGNTTYTRTFTIPNNSSLNPSCSVSVSDAEGYATTYGGYVQGMSKLSVTVTAAPKQGGSIASYKVTANDTVYTSASFTTDVIKTSASSTTISAEVTDQRGYKGTASKTVTVLPYSAPKITKLTVARWNTDTNTEDENGSSIKVTYSGSITSLSNKNSKKWELLYKKSTDTTYSSVTLSTSSYSITDGTKIITADTEYSYDIRLKLSDSFYNDNTSLKAVIMTTSASTAYTIMDFGSDGKSVAFGKVAEIADLVDIGFKLRTYGGILQPVLENGSDLDDLMTPNTYTLKNAISASYSNVPDEYVSTSSTGTLRIESCGEVGQIRQLITLCNSPSPQEYERFYYLNQWYPWKRKLEVVLFDKTSLNNGVSNFSGTITLKESVENFKYIEIFFTDNGDRTGGYTKVYSPNGKTVCLSIVEAAGDTNNAYTYIRRTGYAISEKTLTPDSNLWGYGLMMNTTVSHNGAGKGNYIKIIRVVGYE